MKVFIEPRPAGADNIKVLPNTEDFSQSRTQNHKGEEHLETSQFTVWRPQVG